MRARIVTAVAVFALAAALAGCAAPKPAEPAATPGAEPAAPAEKPAAKVAPVEIGAPVTVADWTLTAKEAERDDEAGGAKAESGKELLVITFDLKNGTATDQGTGPTYFSLTGPDGTTYDAVPTSGEEFIFNTPQPIKAGETRTIKIVYGVPSGAGPFQWMFTPFVEGGSPEPGVVNIK